MYFLYEFENLVVTTLECAIVGVFNFKQHVNVNDVRSIYVARTLFLNKNFFYNVSFPRIDTWFYMGNEMNQNSEKGRNCLQRTANWTYSVLNRARIWRLWWHTPSQTLLNTHRPWWKPCSTIRKSPRNRSEMSTESHENCLKHILWKQP